MTRGIKEVCIANHIEWFNKGQGDVGSFTLEEAKHRFNSAMNEIRHLRKEYPDIKIKFGCELEYLPEWMDDIKKLVASVPFDCVLGSVHIIDGVVISSDKKLEGIFEKNTEETIYTKYFKQLLLLIDWVDFDIVAHFDVIKKYGITFYGPFKPIKYKPIIMEALRLMAQKGIGIELNTGSLHRHCHELFPHPDILKWAVEAGVGHFTLASDSHKPAQAGKNIAQALEYAKDAGIKTLSTYTKRKPKKHVI
jgi:histidinol-phosphatase (PHP family)